MDCLMAFHRKSFQYKNAEMDSFLHQKKQHFAKSAVFHKINFAKMQIMMNVKMRSKDIGNRKIIQFL